MDNARTMQHKIHVGIDLGTTNTVMATCKTPRHRNIMRPTVCQINQYVMEKQIGMEKSLPSVLFFGADGKVKVGRFARDKKLDGADRRILYNTKIDMGRQVEYANGYTPVKAAADILKVCHDTIQQNIMQRGDNEFPDVTITVPASFNQSQIADTIMAAKMAGFEKVSILEEPVAALYHYITNLYVSGDEDTIDFSKKKRMMVYDIGGGTCDVCVVDLQIDENDVYDIHFVATNRYTEFGGNDFDEQAAIGILNKLFQRYEINDSEIDSPELKADLIARIMPFCEQYKIWYSTQMNQGYNEDEVPDAHNGSYGVLHSFLTKYENVELDCTYREYREYTSLFFNDDYRHPTRDLTDKLRDKHVLKPVYQLLKRLKDEGERGIDCIFLTGGMSMYLPIEKALADFCHCPVLRAEEPMDAVALGAAISKFVSTRKDTNDMLILQDDPLREMEDEPAPLQNRQDERPKLPEAIFIDVENQLPMEIIPANITIPCRGEVEHTFHVGSNGVRFHLFAGQSQWDPEMRILYDYAQTFNDLVKPNTEARIRYEIDEDRFLKMQLIISDVRNQVFDLTVDTFEKI